MNWSSNIMVVGTKWLTELAPSFYKKADPSKSTKGKDMEKIEQLFEQLFDQLNTIDSRRLSVWKG
ncbi:hypothetical protein ACHAWX_006670 [Stephanocyclus meneghinianus]